jgi:hypothetical protein
MDARNAGRKQLEYLDTRCYECFARCNDSGTVPRLGRRRSTGMIENREALAHADSPSYQVHACW